MDAYARVDEKDLEVLIDLHLLAETEEEKQKKKEELYSFPEEEPSVPSLYEDCLHPKVAPGYSELPPDTRVVTLPRDKYTAEEAAERFTALQDKYGWSVHGEPFFTVRYWCWRVS